MNTIRKLGKYELRRELGRGAMGVVYEGFDPFIERRVAIKTLSASLLDSSELAEYRERFRREASAAGRLSHPNIVAIYEFGEEAGLTYIAMEYVDGGDLKQVFDRGERLTLAQLLPIMLQLLDTLDYSHRNGIVHRDIKPGNIMLLADGRIKVADFGIARVESSTLTMRGTVLGTPGYMSPEQLQGLPVDGRSDLYSAGVILYQLLTGERPFMGTYASIVHRVLNETPPLPSLVNVLLPRALDEVTSKALARRPDERFQSGAEFARALRRAAMRAPEMEEVTRPYPGLADEESTARLEPPTNARPGTAVSPGATLPLGRSGPPAGPADDSAADTTRADPNSTLPLPAMGAPRQAGAADPSATRIAREAPARPTPARAPEPVPQPAAKTAPAAATAAQTQTRASGARRTALAGGIVAGLVILGTAGYFLTGNKTRPAPQTSMPAPSPSATQSLPDRSAAPPAAAQLPATPAPAAPPEAAAQPQVPDQAVAGPPSGPQANPAAPGPATPAPAADQAVARPSAPEPARAAPHAESARPARSSARVAQAEHPPAARAAPAPPPAPAADPRCKGLIEKFQLEGLNGEEEKYLRAHCTR